VSGGCTPLLHAITWNQINVITILLWDGAIHLVLSSYTRMTICLAPEDV
jgi:hypothetical protein